MNNKYYIYVHINPLKNEIFYVGKGCGKRAWSKYGRNSFWKSIVKKYGYIIDIVEDKLIEDKAYEREIFYIKKIGRRDLGFGPLVNLNDGGKITNGMLGKSHSDETKEKMRIFKTGTKLSKEAKDKISKSKIGKTHFHSEETRKKLSKSHKGKSISNEQRDKISKTLKGRKPKPHSDESKLKLRLKNKLSKKVIYEGTLYNSLNELRINKFPEVPQSTLSRWIKNKKIIVEYASNK
jgi:hypothetical protein